jgi:hypothetical protein
VTNQHFEVPLSDQDVETILKVCGTDALLVGEQALAIWAEYLQVERTGELSAKVTTDADFIGTREVAKRLSLALRWRLYLPSFEDVTSHTAKVSTTLTNGGVKQVDFLNGIIGLDTAKVESRAAVLETAGGTGVRILSPLDLLESRLRNLDILPSKRNMIGVAQAELAIRVVGKFIESLIQDQVHLRVLLDAVKRMAQIAFDARLAQVCFQYDLDPLSAIPASKIPSVGFRERRWPQILARAKKIRQTNIQRAARVSARAKSKIPRG